MNRRNSGQSGLRAFTLIELTMAMTIAAVLLAALGSALVLSARAMPAAGDVRESLTRATAVLERISQEAAMAVGLSGDEHTLRLALPDRDGDGNTEEMRYAWSGNGGEALTLSINGGKEQAVVEGVYDWSLAYVVLSQNLPPTLDGAGGLEGRLLSIDPGTYTDERLRSGVGVGQAFRVSSAAGSSAWSLTRVRLRMRDSSSVEAGAATAVRVYMADSSGLPTGAMLGEVLVAETSLTSSLNWKWIDFGEIKNLSPSATVCVVAVIASGTDPSRIGYATMAAPSNTAMLRTNNNGSTWTSSVAETLCIEVYGKLYGGGQSHSTTPLVDGVEMQLQLDSKIAPAAKASTRVVNRPAVE